MQLLWPVCEPRRPVLLELREQGGGAERVEVRSEEWWGAGSYNAIKALMEGLLLTSCPKVPVLLRFPTRILSDIATLPIES